MAKLELKQVAKSFGDTAVIHGLDLTVDDGEFCVFVGPSGCGKSTLLRMIAGLEECTEGQVLIDADDVTDHQPARRGIAMVFQSYALYPHMTVEENMGFGLKIPKSRPRPSPPKSPPRRAPCKLSTCCSVVRGICRVASASVWP